jgi:hypothetical protein
MIFRKAVLFLAAVAVTSTASAYAQFGVYGEFTVDRLSNLQSSPLLPTPAPKVDPVNPLGGTGGVYYDFLKLGPVKLGGDVRGSILTTKRGAFVTANAGGTRIYSVLGGVRAAIHTPIAPLKPYVQFSAGLGRSDYGLSRTTSTGQIIIYNNFQYEGLAGLDVKLLPILDWRVAELGYGGLNSFGSLGHNYPIKQVSMGFVFHLP